MFPHIRGVDALKKLTRNLFVAASLLLSGGISTMANAQRPPARPPAPLPRPASRGRRHRLRRWPATAPGTAVGRAPRCAPVRATRRRYREGPSARRSPRAAPAKPAARHRHADATVETLAWTAAEAHHLPHHFPHQAIWRTPPCAASLDLCRWRVHACGRGPPPPIPAGLPIQAMPAPIVNLFIGQKAETKAEPTADGF